MRKTLVVKLGAIGDVVMALPILDSIWKADAEEHVEWLVGRVAAPILESITDPRFHIHRIDERALFKGSMGERLKVVLRTWWDLGLARFDRILILNSDSRYAILPLLCRGSREWFRNGGKHRAAVPGRHHSVEYVRLLSGLDDSSLLQPTYPPVHLPELPEDLARDLIRIRRPLVAISPGGAKNVMREEGLRRWPIESYRSVARKLRENGCSVFLVGGPGDEWTIDAFKGEYDLELVGKLDLTIFLKFLSCCNLLLTHDSGPLHLADLVGTPVVGIFGPTSPEEKKPIRADTRILVAEGEMWCRPCYDGRNYAPCTSPECMARISSSAVVATVMELLGPR